MPSHGLWPEDPRAGRNHGRSLDQYHGLLSAQWLPEGVGSFRVTDSLSTRIRKKLDRDGLVSFQD